MAPYGTVLGTGARFRFLCPEGAETRPQIAAFKDWMLREIDKTSDIANAFKMLERSIVK